MGRKFKMEIKTRKFQLLQGGLTCSVASWGSTGWRLGGPTGRWRSPARPGGTWVWQDATQTARGSSRSPLITVTGLLYIMKIKSTQLWQLHRSASRWQWNLRRWECSWITMKVLCPSTMWRLNLTSTRLPGVRLGVRFPHISVHIYIEMGKTPSLSSSLLWKIKSSNLWCSKGREVENLTNGKLFESTEWFSNSNKGYLHFIFALFSKSIFFFFKHKICDFPLLHFKREYKIILPSCLLTRGELRDCFLTFLD